MEKKDITSTLIKKVPNLVDIQIQSRLDALKNNKINFNSSFWLSPSPPSQGPLPSPPPPPLPCDRPRLTQTAQQLSPVKNIFQPVTQALSPPPSYYFPGTTNTNVAQAIRFGEAVLEQELVKEIDDVPPPPTIELANKILTVLDDGERVL